MERFGRAYKLQFDLGSATLSDVNRNGLLFGFVKRRVTFAKFVRVSACALWAAVAVACSSNPAPTYANVTVSFSDGIVVDQLRFELLQNNVAITDPVVRPDAPGAPLTTDVTVTILLPDSVVGRSLSVRVTGLYQGADVTSGRIDDILPLPDRGVDVNITLGHVLRTLTVDPTSVTIALGGVQQIRATGTFSDENNGDASEQADWSSANSAVATVDNTPGSRGLVRAVSEGTTTVTVSLQGTSITVPVQVTGRRITQLTIAPNPYTLASGATGAVRATATYSDGSSLLVTNDVTWQTTDPVIATVANDGAVTTGQPGTVTVTAAYQGSTASSFITVVDPAVARIVIEAPSATVPAGFTLAFTAIAIYTDGSQAPVTANTTFSTDNSIIASFTGASLRGNTAGSVTVTGLYAPPGRSYTATTPITISSATLSSFTIAALPGTSVAAGTTITYTATGLYSDGTTGDITSLVSFASNTPAVATNASNPNGPIFSTPAAGTARITATRPVGTTVPNQTSNVTVTAATLQSVSVTPSSPTVGTCETATFTATANFSDGSTSNVTASATWSSASASTPGVVDQSTTAPFNSFVGRKTGTVTILATYLGRTGQTVLTVSGAALTSIDITPASPRVAKGASLQLVATGHYSDSSTPNISNTATWSVDNTTIASISNTTPRGLLRALNTGSTVVTASYCGVTGTTTATLNTATVDSLAISPSNQTIPLGTSLQLTATATLSDGTTAPYTTNANLQWTSSDNSVATVSNGASGGSVTSVSVSATPVTITATYTPPTGQLGSIQTATTQVTVRTAVVQSLAVAPTAITIAPGQTNQFTVVATYTDGTTGVVPDPTRLHWTSSSTATANIDDQGSTAGLATGAAAGTTNIIARYTRTTGEVITSNAAVLTVSPLSSIAVTPATLTLAISTSGNLVATGTYGNGVTRDITRDVSWSLDSTTSATISNSGVNKGRVTATTVTGNAVATATGFTRQGTATVVVNNGQLASVDVTCTPTAVPAGDAVACTATGHFDTGATQELTSQLFWSSSNTSYASVSNGSGTQGQVTTNLAGESQSVTITASPDATIGNPKGSATITINPKELRSVTVTPSTTTSPVGTAVQFTATAVYSAGSETVTTGVGWQPTAVCDPDGMCTPVDTTPVTITATYSGKSGTAVLTGVAN